MRVRQIARWQTRSGPDQRAANLPVAGTENTETTVMCRNSREEGQIIYGVALYTNN